MRLTLSLAALAATLASTSPALAATTTAVASAEARGLVLQPLTLTKVSDLDFGTIIGSTSAGSVTIDSDTGARAKTGGVLLVTAYPGGRATFAGAGTAGTLVTLNLTKPAVLVSTSNPTDTLVVTTLSLDSNGANRSIDTTGAFTVGVGGNFAIAASQPNGLYTAQFDLTADYQ